MAWNVLFELCCGSHLTTGSRIGKEEDLYGRYKSKTEIEPRKYPGI